MNSEVDSDRVVLMCASAALQGEVIAESERKIEIPLPNDAARLDILQIHTQPIAKQGEIDWEAVVKLAEGFNGADMRNICTEAGMMAIRAERDLLVRALAAQARLFRFVHTPAAKGPFIAARRSVFPTMPMSDHEAEWRFVQTYKPFATGLVLSPERLEYMQKVNIAFDIQTKILPFAQVADMTIAADALKLLERTRT